MRCARRCENFVYARSNCISHGLSLVKSSRYNRWLYPTCIFQFRAATSIFPTSIAERKADGGYRRKGSVKPEEGKAQIRQQGDSTQNHSMHFGIAHRDSRQKSRRFLASPYRKPDIVFYSEFSVSLCVAYTLLLYFRASGGTDFDFRLSRLEPRPFEAFLNTSSSVQRSFAPFFETRVTETLWFKKKILLISFRSCCTYFIHYFDRLAHCLAVRLST